jgi:hypothetical protein
MMGLRQDRACGFRTLCKHTGFTAAAIISLALGIGANTAVYSLEKALLLLSFPFRDSDRSYFADLVLQCRPSASGRGTDAGFMEQKRPAFRHIL